VVLLLILVFAVTSFAGNPFAKGLDKDKAAYVGGTADIREGTVGICSVKDEAGFTFAYIGTKLTIPYDRIESLEYGQKTDRLSAAYISKKRRHFLTIAYKDAADKRQAVVLELGKDIVRPTLAALQARTGRKIEFQDDEARKAGLQ
jgi:hypothetical protein